jgi:hypothetical protein
LVRPVELPQRQSFATSDDQTCADKLLAKSGNRHDHSFAAGRRFHIQVAPSFSSRLSRYSAPFAFIHDEVDGSELIRAIALEGHHFSGRHPPDVEN